jgi:hypothetical protein
MSDEEDPLSTDDEPRVSALLAAGKGSFPVADLLTRWETRQPSLGESPAFFRPSLHLNIDPDQWTHGLEVHTRELPQELFNSLRERTPQALLRDLHRPVIKFYVEPALIEGTEVIGQLNLEFEKLRQARKLDPRPSIEPTVNVFHAEQTRRRGFLAKRWEPILSDETDRKTVRVWQDQAEEPEKFYRPDFGKYGK